MRGGKMLNNAGAVKRLLRRVRTWRPDRAGPGAAGAIDPTADTGHFVLKPGSGLGVSLLRLRCGLRPASF